MTTEEDRHELYEAARRGLGDGPAATLMGQLDAMDPERIATKHDLVELRGDLRREMAELRSDLRGEMAELRGDLRGEMAELRSEMAELRGDLRGEMADLRGDLRGEIADLRTEWHRDLARHTRVTVLATVTMNAATMGVVIALVGAS